MTTFKSFLILLLAVSFSRAGAQDQRLHIVDSLISKLKVEKNILYNKTGRPLLLDIYYPQKLNKKKMPTVVWIHGGGLTNAKLTKDYDIVRWGAAETALNGFIAVSIDYRLVTEIPLPACIEDCFTAIRFLKANAKKYHIDPKRIGVVGESSGGYLSSFVTYAGDDHSFITNDWKKYPDHVKCGVIWYGYTKHPNSTYNVLDYISTNDPPSLLIHGQDDKIVPLQNSYDMQKKCEEKGLTVDLKVIPNADHGFFDVNGKFEDYRKHMEEALDLSIGFFKKHL
jgi:acetyl esterase/lipase